MTAVASVSGTTAQGEGCVRLAEEGHARGKGRKVRVRVRE